MKGQVEEEDLGVQIGKEKVNCTMKFEEEKVKTDTHRISNTEVNEEFLQKIVEEIEQLLTMKQQKL